MARAQLTLDADYEIARVDARLYGSFAEHLGRSIYGGLYEPGHPTADENGFRGDVLKLTKALGVTTVRYPGGNFVSGFRWEDSIGPKERRPKRLDPAWFSTESNEFGLHEYVAWCKAANVSPLYAINLGTRGVDAARELVEYCNHPSGSYWSDLRRKNGAENPFGIKLWCLGNEMDGPWQIGHKTAAEYGRAACEAAKAMKWVDPSIELVACGSSSERMSTFGAWELEVLDQCYNEVDYISLHRYFGDPKGDTASFLSGSMELEDFIRAVECACDAIRGKKHAKKRVNLSFDEWNVWYHSHARTEEIQRARAWGEAPEILEDEYNFEDALLCGCTLLTFLRHADRVKVACLAQLVNVIAPIMTRTGGPAWAQPTYWPFALCAKYARGVSLMPVLRCDAYDCKAREGVPMLEIAATREDDGTVTLLCVNRASEDVDLSARLRGFGQLSLAEHTALHHDDPHAVNTECAPNAVTPVKGAGGTLDGDAFSARVGKMSFNVYRFCEARA